MKLLYFLVFALFSATIGQAQNNQEPFAYWSFEGQFPYNSDKGNFKIRSLRNDCPILFLPGAKGMSAQVEGNAECWFQTNSLSGYVKDRLTLSFFFKGSTFNFSSYSKSTIILQLRYPNFRFKTTVEKDGKEITDDWLIPLNGSGIQSYDYLADGNWHQVLINVDAKTGKKQIWVDGQSSEYFTRNITPGVRIVTEKSDGFIQFQQLDEVAFYSSIQLPSINSRKDRSVKSSGIDPLEYAEGHPAYRQTLYQQLNKFPSPRFANTQVPRLISWMNIQYLHRELEKPGTKGFGKQNPERAVAVSDLMINKWNYYLEVPLLFEKDTALVAYARSHPEYPVSTISYQTSTGTQLLSNSLSSSYYMKDASGSLVLWKNKKWLKPWVMPELAARDGAVTGGRLRKLKEAIGREPALINENGEIFGHIRPLELLQKDPEVLFDFQQSDLSVSDYSGRMQFRMDSAYKSAALTAGGIKKSIFSFYNLSAIQPSYWPSYSQRRELHRQSDARIRSTPDFYPRKPAQWLLGAGAFNGFKTIAAGRKTELTLGDPDFSPFVGAGWGEETENIRPAQWLSLLKAMVMLGAENFYVGYFNVTGKGGKWPNGFGPNDPAGYAYQVAMPAYAQALRTWAPVFFTNGKLLEPDASDTNMDIPFCYKGSAANDLILVRQSGKQYLIYCSIQPNSNEKGNVPLERETSFNLEGSRITLTTRRQGSIYLLDKTDTRPVVRQLDSWHQYEHPAYWSSQIVEDAVNYTDFRGQPVRVTKLSAPDFWADAVSYVNMKQFDAIEFSQLPGDKGKFEIQLAYTLPENSRQTELIIELGNRKEKFLLANKENFIVPGMFIVDSKNTTLKISVNKGALSLQTIRLQNKNLR